MQRFVLVVVAFFAVTSGDAAVAQTYDTRLVLCIPGGPGSTADAQPVVDRFLSALSASVALGTTEGTYYTDTSSCERAIRSAAKTTIVMVPLTVYLTKRTPWKLRSVVSVDTSKTSGKYHWVAPKGETLESLRGKKVVTGLQASAQFLGKVAFSGKVDVSGGYDFKKVRSSLSAIKQVAKGRASAVIVDDLQRKSLASLPIAQDLVVIHSGPDLPEALVAIAGGRAPKSLGKALLGVCKKDKKLCKDMRLSGFKSIAEKRLTQLEQQLSQ